MNQKLKIFQIPLRKASKIRMKTTIFIIQVAHHCKNSTQKQVKAKIKSLWESLLQILKPKIQELALAAQKNPIVAHRSNKLENQREKRKNLKL